MRKIFFRKKEKKFSPHQIASRNYYHKKGGGWAKKLSLWFIFFSFLGLFYLCFYSGYFNIAEIDIARAGVAPQKISDEQIQNYIYSVFSQNRYLFFPQNNFLVFDRGAAESLIKKNFIIEKAVIKKKFPRQLIVEIEEKVAVANLAIAEKKEPEKIIEEAVDKIATTTATTTPKIMETATTTNDVIAEKINYKYYLIDKRGDILEEIMAPDTKLPAIYDMRTDPKYPYISEKKISFIAELFKKFPQRILDTNLIAFELQEDKETGLIARTTGGWYIYVDFNQDIREQLEKLFLTLQEKIKDQQKNLQYIDLRFESRVYYK